MKKLNIRYFWFCIIIFQIIIGVGTGFLVLSAVETETIINNISIDNLNLKGLTLAEAEEAINDYYSSFPDSNLTFHIGENSFTIPYSDIEARVDAEKTIEAIKSIIPENGFNQLFVSPDKEYIFNPVITFNAEKLKKVCRPVFSPFEIEPAAERYDVEDGVIIYTPQKLGIKTDYEMLIKEIEKHLNSSLRHESLKIDINSSSIFVENYIDKKYEDKFSVIVSKAEIPFPDITEVQEFLNSLHGVVFKNNEEINLRNLLDFSQFSNGKDILNRIASGLYQSALKIEGIEVLERNPSRHSVSFTEIGLEAVIENDDHNLIMVNKTSSPLMLLIEHNENTATFYMVSDKTLRSGILIVQKEEEIPPPIITSVNEKLSPNKNIVVSEGNPGFTVSVSLIIENDRIELYRDQYAPVNKVIETGKSPGVSVYK